jgi:putative membrane protein
MVWFGHIWILFIQLVFWGGLIALVVWAVRRFTAPRPDNALSILNERFARGEIDQQEYDTRKTALLRR